jgi:hypothetical protein
MITPVSWETGSNYEPFRSGNFGENGDTGLQQVINLPFDVFEDAYVDTMICIFTPGNVPNEFEVKEFDKRHQIQNTDEIKEGHERIDYQHLRDDPATKVYVTGSIYDLMGKYGSQEYNTVGEVTDSTQGPVESHYDYSDSVEDSSQLRYRDLDVYRYSLSVTGERYIFMEEDNSDRNYYTTPRVLIRRLISRDDRIMAMYETESYVVKKDLNPFIRDGATESLQYLLANLNSALHSYLYINRSSLALKDDFRQTTLTDLRQLPYRTLDVETDADYDPSLSDEIQELIEEAVAEDSSAASTTLLDKVQESIGEDEEFVHDVIVALVEKLIETKEIQREVNTDFLTYFGENLKKENLDSPKEYTKLSEVSGYQPPQNKSPLLTTTTGSEYESIEIINATVSEENRKAKLLVDIRTREDTSEPYEYHNNIPAATFLDLGEEELQLLRGFLPEAIERASGYANFRNYATGSQNTLEDRLKELRLPSSSAVSDDVERFMEQKRKNQTLKTRISEYDNLLDHIIYRLYNLDEEQIERIERRLK